MRSLVWLGVALGALVVTKLQFFACTAPPIVAMLAATLIRDRASPRRWLTTATVVLAPSLALGSVYLWTVRGTENFFAPPSETAGMLAHHWRYIQLAMWDFFSGNSHDSFWGIFGWNDAPIVIHGVRTTAVVQFILRAFARVTVALTLVGIGRTSLRLLRLARRKRIGQAVRIALSNPVVNSLFVFSIVMTTLFVRTENRFAAQGRNWLPVILPIFLLGVVYAPRALAWKPAIRAYSITALVGLLLYDAIGGYYALRTVRDRYYVPFTSSPTQSTLISTEPADAHLAVRAGDGWKCSSRESHLIFKVEPELFVHGIRLEFKVTSACASGAFRVVWRSGESDSGSAVFNLPTNGVPRSVTVWTNGSIREFHVFPDDQPCRVEITSLTLFH